MKLQTIMTDYGNGDALLVYDGDIGVSPEKQAEHDAAAAHALLHAMEENDMDGWDYNANVVAIVRQRADELMREWGFTDDSSSPE